VGIEVGWVSAAEVGVGVSILFVWVGDAVGDGIGSWLSTVAVGETVAVSLTGEIGKRLLHAARVSTRRNRATQKAKQEDFAE
jgi:hypothetical protein